MPSIHYRISKEDIEEDKLGKFRTDVYNGLKARWPDAEVVVSVAEKGPSTILSVNGAHIPNMDVQQVVDRARSNS